MSAWMYSASKLTAFKTRNASGSTWFPIPSPGIVTTVCFAMNAFLLRTFHHRDTEAQRVFGCLRDVACNVSTADFSSGLGALLPGSPLPRRLRAIAEHFPAAGTRTFHR